MLEEIVVVGDRGGMERRGKKRKGMRRVKLFGESQGLAEWSVVVSQKRNEVNEKKRCECNFAKAWKWLYLYSNSNMGLT